MGVGDATRPEALLERVFRTFALTIPTLPEDLRSVIGNAYLLCRIVDTVEDEPKLSPAQKKEFSEKFVRVVRGEGDAGAFSAALAPLLSEATLPSVHDLIRQTAAVLGVTRSLSSHASAFTSATTRGGKSRGSTSAGTILQPREAFAVPGIEKLGSRLTGLSEKRGALNDRQNDR